MNKAAKRLIVAISFCCGFLAVYILLHQVPTKISESENGSNNYLLLSKQFKGLPSEFLFIRGDTPNLIRDKIEDSRWLLILYFRMDDCGGCLYEMKNVYEALKRRGVKVILSTDHPVPWEILYFMRDYELDEVAWDTSQTLLGSKVKATPSYFLIRGNKKIIDEGIIAPVKDAPPGSFVRILKKRLRKYRL